jgi:twitching motility protein PilJ
MSNGNKAPGAAGERRTFFVLLALIMVATLGLSLYTFSTVAEREAEDSESLIHVRDIRLNSPELAQLSNEATRGNFNAFPQLRQVAEALDASVAHLGGEAGRILRESDLGQTPAAGAEGAAQGDDHGAADAQHNITYTDPAVVEQINATAAVWADIAAQVNDVLESRVPLGNVYRLAGEAETDHIPQLRDALQALVDDLVESNARPEQIARVGDLILYNAQLTRDLGRLLRDPNLSDEAQEEAATQLIVNVANIGEILDGLVAGSDELKIRRVPEGSSRDLLDQAVEIFFTLGDLMFELEERLPDLYAARESAVALADLVTRMTQTSQQLEESIQTLQSGRFLTTEIGYYAGAAGLLAMLLLAGISYSDTRRRHAETVRQKQVADQLNQRNQEAILQLLDELSYLAEGDLSKQATVTEEITGAIADSVNYAIDALRNLVNSINQTSQQVTGAAQKSRATTLQLALASQQQAGQIAEASTRIGAMAQEMESVSSEANNSAEVAKRSVEIAHQGGEVVRNSITGMDTIREQIQETSKRIKRLGESSQEIGAIVELINDIADQTNILALNAAIQAAMAGEAGRGFAVVADEVQRLAERSTDATKQIGALINTIQADTNEAVTSMERSTANVVSGAQLAGDAGKALEQIEQVSSQLYDLIHEIAETTRREATTAAEVAGTMNDIREVTTQTTAGTNETANSIGKLAELAEQLRESVAGFKLPEST